MLLALKKHQFTYREVYIRYTIFPCPFIVKRLGMPVFVECYNNHNINKQKYFILLLVGNYMSTYMEIRRKIYRDMWHES